MAYLKFSRDKRGYEHFSLVQPITRRGKTESRLLYYYRTPPNVGVGRDPFDEAMRRSLEAQYPNVTFDWKQIVATPIPSADADLWRERRRANRAARQFAAEEDAAPSEVSERQNGETGVRATPSVQGEDGATPVEGSATGVVGAGMPPISGDASQRSRRRRRGRRRDGAVAEPARPQATSDVQEPRPTATVEHAAPVEHAEPHEPREPAGD